MILRISTDMRPFDFEVDAEPNGGYDTSLSIDRFILTDLRTLLFGEK